MLNHISQANLLTITVAYFHFTAAIRMVNQMDLGL